MPGLVTYFTTADLKRAYVSDKVAVLSANDAIEGGLFFWEDGDFSAAGEGPSILESDAFPLSVGAWVRQTGAQVASRVAPTTSRETVDTRLNDLPIMAAASFGVTAGTAIDQAPAINAAIDVAIARGLTLVLPEGDIRVATPITLKVGLRLRGHTDRVTRLIHSVGATGPMFNLASDAITDCRIGDFWCVGNGESGEHCFHLVAQPSLTTPFHGGLWYAVFYDLFIGGFGGKAIWLQSTGDTEDLLHQFNVFRDVQIERPVGSGSRCFSATGKVGQIYFEGACRFDGPAVNPPSVSPGANIVFSREFVGPASARGDAWDAFNLSDPSSISANAGWSPVSDRHSYGCYPRLTSQNSDYAIVIDRGVVYVEDCYFENLDRAILSFASAIVTVRACEARNAGGFYTPGGFFAATAAAGTILHSGNIILSACGTPYRRADGGSIISQSASIAATTPSADSSSQPTASQVGVISSVTDIGLATEIYINAGNPASLHTLTSLHTSASRVTLYPVQVGSGDVLTLTAGGNITSREIAAGNSVTLRTGDSVMLTRQGTAWAVTARSIAPLTSAGMPSSGYFQQGEFVSNTSASAFAPDTNSNLLVGWQRTSSGSGHVSGTDWQSVFAKTISA